MVLATKEAEAFSAADRVNEREKLQMDVYKQKKNIQKERKREREIDREKERKREREKEKKRKESTHTLLSEVRVARYISPAKKAQTLRLMGLFMKLTRIGDANAGRELAAGLQRGLLA